MTSAMANNQQQQHQQHMMSGTQQVTKNPTLDLQYAAITFFDFLCIPHPYLNLCTYSLTAGLVASSWLLPH